MAKETKLNKRSPGNKPWVPFQTGSIHLLPSSDNYVEKGPTKRPIKIKGKMAGIPNFHAAHCAKIPNIMIPDNSNIGFNWCGKIVFF